MQETYNGNIAFKHVQTVATLLEYSNKCIFNKTHALKIKHSPEMTFALQKTDGKSL